jgi:hypothetical protein
MKKKQKDENMACLPQILNQPIKKEYQEEIYEQLIYLNEKMERFLQFIKYAAVGGFLTTAIYFMLKMGKIL